MYPDQPKTLLCICHAISITVIIIIIINSYGESVVDTHLTDKLNVLPLNIFHNHDLHLGEEM